MSSIEDQLRAYITTSAGLTQSPRDADRLVEKGFIPSVRLLDLVGFIEDTFAIKIRPVDLAPDKLATIAQLAAMVRARQSAPRRSS